MICCYSWAITHLGSFRPKLTLKWWAEHRLLRVLLLLIAFTQKREMFPHSMFDFALQCSFIIISHIYYFGLKATKTDWETHFVGFTWLIVPLTSHQNRREAVGFSLIYRFIRKCDINNTIQDRDWVFILLVFCIVWTSCRFSVCGFWSGFSVTFVSCPVCFLCIYAMFLYSCWCTALCSTLFLNVL